MLCRYLRSFLMKLFHTTIDKQCNGLKQIAILIYVPPNAHISSSHLWSSTSFNHLTLLLIFMRQPNKNLGIHFCQKLWELNLHYKKRDKFIIIILEEIGTSLNIIKRFLRSKYFFTPYNYILVRFQILTGSIIHENHPIFILSTILMQ